MYRRDERSSVIVKRALRIDKRLDSAKPSMGLLVRSRLITPG